MPNVKSVLIAGVGGQGAILIRRIMTEGLMEAGFDVKQSEVHGMAQRGGSVSTQVRFGDKVYGPVFGKGEADILIALEQMEAVRYAPFLKPDGVAVINAYRQESAATAAGLFQYPEGCLEAMQKQFKCIVVPANEIAEKLGNPRCMNVVLFGACCGLMGADSVNWEDVVRKVVPAKALELNLAAFRAGLAAAEKQE